MIYIKMHRRTVIRETFVPVEDEKNSSPPLT